MRTGGAAAELLPVLLGGLAHCDDIRRVDRSKRTVRAGEHGEIAGRVCELHADLSNAPMDRNEIAVVHFDDGHIGTVRLGRTGLPD